MGLVLICDEFYLQGSQNSEYDQEIPQSQTAEKAVAPRGRVLQQSRGNLSKASSSFFAIKMFAK